MHTTQHTPTHITKHITIVWLDICSDLPHIHFQVYLHPIGGALIGGALGTECQAAHASGIHGPTSNLYLSAALLPSLV